MKDISLEDLKTLNKSYQKNKTHQVLKRVLFNHELSNIFEVSEKQADVQFLFSHDIKTLPVANQKQSGRCWIFAGLNILREEIAKKYQLDDFYKEKYLDTIKHATEVLPEEIFEISHGYFIAVIQGFFLKYFY